MPSEQPVPHEEDVGTEVQKRDHLAELKALIDAETSHGDFIASDVAERIVEKLRAHDPDLLLGFLEAQAAQALTRLILHIHSLRKAAAKRSAPARRTGRSVFSKALEAHEDGDEEPIEELRRGWLDTVIEGAEGVMSHLRDCRKEHLEFAVGKYRRREESNRFERMFLESIAKKIGNKTVGDHFTDEQLRAMRESLSSS